MLLSESGDVGMNKDRNPSQRDGGVGPLEA